MTSWKTYKIVDLCKISSSKRIFAKEYKDSGIPFYRGKEIIEKQKGNKISTELYISQERYDEIKAKHGVPQKGDMLLTSVGTLGIPYIVQDEVFYFKDGNLTWFYNFEGLDSRYLYYWFLSPIGKMNIDSKAIGSTQKALTIETLSKFEISLPSLEEQRRIAGILGAIDDKIENNRRINDNLEQQAQALYKQWFVDFNFPNEEGKPYKSSGGKMIDSELGPIPEGWRVQTISDISVRIASGGTPKSLNESYYNGEIKWFTTKELKDCFLIDSDKHISMEALNDSAAKLFPKNTILMAIYAAPTVGRLGILTAESTFNQAAVGIVAKEEIGHLFVYLTLLAERENLNNLASGAAQQNLNVGIVKQYKLIVPTKKLLIEFNQIAGSLFERIKVVSNENKTLATLRDTLLPKLMNGEIKL